MKSFLLTSLFAISQVCSAASLSPAAQEACEAARELSGAVCDCDMSWMVDRMYPPLKRLLADQLSMKDAAARRASAQRFMGSTKETDAQALSRIAANERALRNKYIVIGSQMKKQGIRVESFTVSPAVAEYELALPRNVAKGVYSDKKGNTSAEDLTMGQDRSRLVVLPTTLIVSVPNPQTGERVRVEQKSHIYAVRDEQVAQGANTRGTVLNKWYFIDGKTEVRTLRSFFINIPLRLKLPINSSRQL